MKELLRANDVKLTRSLGQNFLFDGNQVRRIVEAAALEAEDRVLEIGPGLGPLTEHLVARAKEVWAVEKDQRMVAILQRRLSQAGNLRLIHADALDWLDQAPRDWRGWKVVSNLPYYITSPLLLKLLETHHVPDRLVITVQREAAHRLLASTGDTEYGPLALRIRLHYEPRASFKIPASCFYPPPEVVSTCVTLVARPTALLAVDQARLFSDVVAQGFSQRRKKMFKLLAARWPESELAAAFERAGLSPQARAESVSLEQFVQLTQFLFPA